MPWKEPGEKPREPKGREPWGQGGGQGGGPDLDAWLRKARRRLGPFGRGPMGALALIVVLIVLWFVIGGWTSIGGQQVGVLLRFGHFQRVLQPGVHLHLPLPIDNVQKVDVDRVRTVNDEARVLTSDGQLVLVDYDVHYKVSDARAFLYATRDAEEVVRNAATSAVRAAAGTHAMQCLTDNLGLPCAAGPIDTDKFGADVLARLHASLPDARDKLGAAITDVDVQSIGVPSDVKQAFDAIAKARDDAKTMKTSADADVARRKVEVKNEAASIKADAEAYRHQTVADADAAVARFDRILPQYQAAPQVTRHRLWLDTMQAVLTRNRVVVNTGSGDVIVQFPAQHSDVGGTPASAASSASPSSAVPVPPASVVTPVTSGPGVQAVD
ncbi:MAG TPA: FtsH protease activity modulator HflK [Rhodanobacteraceae bacterium]|jgi:membrane protease subunit HflK|nr:FtsH protease activity modulator HflK [Rhodanobacteraceae bacterium]